MPLIEADNLVSFPISQFSLINGALLQHVSLLSLTSEYSAGNDVHAYPLFPIKTGISCTDVGLRRWIYMGLNPSIPDAHMPRTHVDYMSKYSAWTRL